MCSLSFGSALTDSSSPILAASLPWSPPEELAGPVIAVLVIGAILLGFLIGVIAAWLASKVLISNYETTFAAAVAVCFLQFAAGLGIAIFHALVVFIMGTPSNSASGALSALCMLVGAVVLNIKIAGKVYGIGALQAFCFNLLSSFFTLLICGVVAGAVLVVGGIGVGAARARMQASAEQLQHGGLNIIPPSTAPEPTPAPDFSAEIDSLLDAALHPLADMKKHEGDDAPDGQRNADANADANAQKMIDQGFKAFYSDASAETKMDVAPLIEQIQRNLQNIR